ncbi:MAG: hypothetical protein JSS02_31950 [Planctomycetes bacterium]|nr:hypothetical protein [Planctomycetota bacterium]
MLSRDWLKGVERELLSRSLPRQEVARLVAELADHLADALDGTLVPDVCPVEGPVPSLSVPSSKTEDVMSMEANVIESLGSPTEIASVAVREFQRRKPLLSRSWVAAACAFVLLPLPALVVGWGLALALAVGIAAGLEKLGIPDPAAAHAVSTGLVVGTYVVLYVILLAPAAGVSVLFVRLAKKTARAGRWGLVACAIVALATACARLDASFSELPGKSTLTLGLQIGDALPWSSLGQFLIPLAIGVLALWRQQGRLSSPAAV